MVDLDTKLKNIFSESISVPQNCSNALRDALYKKKKANLFGHYNWSKVVAAICICTIIGGGVVFARNIINNFFNTSKGLDIAIENGYIEQPDIEYIKSNGTEIKVDHIVMDDFNLNLAFSIRLNENNINSDEITRMRFSKMIITDEQNRIIYCSDKETFEQYCSKNNLTYVFSEFNENYINTGSNWFINSKSDGEINLIYNLYANTFPKSKKLVITLFEIACSKNEISENEEFALTGNWNMDLSIPEKFYNREAFVYTVKSCSDSSLNITEAIVYNTGMRFKFATQVKPIYDENDSEKLKDEKMNEFSEWRTKSLEDDKNFINKEYIENENGKRFYPLKSSTEDARTSYLVDGEFMHWQTFDLTQYDMTDKIKIYFNMHLPYEDKDVVVELERISQ